MQHRPRRPAGGGRSDERPGLLAYVEQFLAPGLRCGDVVVLDNLGGHKVASVKNAIRAAGANVFYLPLYSPDLNSIEQTSVKLRALFRRATVRTRETLWSTIEQMLGQVRPDECPNSLANCGA